MFCRSNHHAANVVIIEGGDIHVVARHAANSVMVSSGVGYTGYKSLDVT